MLDFFMKMSFKKNKKLQKQQNIMKLFEKTRNKKTNETNKCYKRKIICKQYRKCTCNRKSLKEVTCSYFFSFSRFYFFTKAINVSFMHLGNVYRMSSNITKEKALLAKSFICFKQKKLGEFWTEIK